MSGLAAEKYPDGKKEPVWLLLLVGAVLVIFISAITWIFRHKPFGEIGHREFSCTGPKIKTRRFWQRQLRHPNRFQLQTDCGEVRTQFLSPTKV